mmetsp:Transcript_9158/g.27006  ORF Transcript_9158/g.27006 Transcript_9158/m.27006 type:complete len:192 (-) Transcript_9158:565-1140(-)
MLDIALRLAIVAVASSLVAGIACKIVLDRDTRPSLSVSSADQAIHATLLVGDVLQSIAFYRDVLGFRVAFTMDAFHNVVRGDVQAGAVLGMLRFGKATLTLRTARSLSQDLPGCFVPGQCAAASGLITLLGMDPDEVSCRLPAESILKGPSVSYNGLRELHFRDPDSYIICVSATAYSASQAHAHALAEAR